MKKKLFLFLVLSLLVVSFACAGMIIQKFSSGGGSCTTVLWTNTGTTTGDLDIKDNAFYTYVGQVVEDTNDEADKVVLKSFENMGFNIKKVIARGKYPGNMTTIKVEKIKKLIVMLRTRHCNAIY